MKRLNWSEVAPAGAKALYAVHHYVTNSTALPEELIHLVFLRVSQINGCAHRIDLHTRDLLRTMPIEKVAPRPVWTKSCICSPTNIALLWLGRRKSRASARPMLPTRPAQQQPRHSSRKTLVDLTIMIVSDERLQQARRTIPSSRLPPSPEVCARRFLALRYNIKSVRDANRATRPRRALPFRKYGSSSYARPISIGRAFFSANRRWRPV